MERGARTVEPDSRADRSVLFVDRQFGDEVANQLVVDRETA